MSFSTPHQFNKYHFGVICQFISASGLILTRKTKNPMHAGAFFVGGMALNSGLAYYEGVRDLREKQPVSWDTATWRLTGFYMILAGFGILYLKSAGYVIV